MRMSRQLGISVLAGTLAELILIAPLVFVSGTFDLGPIPQWVLLLQKFQIPGYPLVESLVRTKGIRTLAARFPEHWILFLQLLATAIQSAVFALAALGIIRLRELWRKSRTRIDLIP